MKNIFTFITILLFILITSTCSCQTLTKEDENYCKDVAFGLSNVWYNNNDSLRVVGALEGPSGFMDHPIIVFELFILKPFPIKAGSPYKIGTFEVVSFSSKTGLCKIQPYSINPSKIEYFSCDGDHINFKWNGYDIAIVKGEKYDSTTYKCHILFTEKYWDSISKNWVEKQWKSVDGIKIGEVILH